MNAGAFGHSISEVVESVKVDGKWLSREECGFGYRTSGIEGEIQDVKWRDSVCEEGDAASFLARLMKLKVKFRFGVVLEPEVRGLDA